MAVGTGTSAEAAAQAALRAAKPEEVIFAERARALAREPRAARATEDYLEVVEFLLAQEKFAVESLMVREVYPLKDLTVVPCTPPFVRGIINVRGQILTVIDLKKFFGMPEKGLTDLNKVIIVRAGGMELGLLADAVFGVRSLEVRDLQPALPTLDAIGADYLRGVTSGRTVVLDLMRILRDERIIVREEVGG